MVAPISNGSIQMEMMVGLERAQSLPSVREKVWLVRAGGKTSVVVWQGEVLLGCVKLCCITSGLAVLICSFSSGSRNRFSTDSALLDI
jgi:hypothetical protein